MSLLFTLTPSKAAPFKPRSSFSLFYDVSAVPLFFCHLLLPPAWAPPLPRPHSPTQPWQGSATYHCEGFTSHFLTNPPHQLQLSASCHPDFWHFCSHWAASPLPPPPPPPWWARTRCWWSIVAWTGRRRRSDVWWKSQKQSLPSCPHLLLHPPPSSGWSSGGGELTEASFTQSLSFSPAHSLVKPLSPPLLSRSIFLRSHVQTRFSRYLVLKEHRQYCQVPNIFCINWHWTDALAQLWPGFGL